MTLTVLTVLAATGSEVTQRNAWKPGLSGRAAPKVLGRGRRPARGPTPEFWRTAGHAHPPARPYLSRLLGAPARREGVVGGGCAA